MPPPVYGVDVQALVTLPDPEVLSTELATAAYQCGRRWATPSGALEEIGEIRQYDSIDVREWLGGRFNASDPSVMHALARQALEVLYDEPFVVTAQVTASYNNGTITLSAQVEGSNGPFAFVLQASALTVQLLLPGQA